MTNTDLLTTIQRVRRRWRLALVLRGAAICVVTALALLALSAFGFAQLGLSSSTIIATRIAVALIGLAVLIITVALPMLQRVSNARVALYIEEREPALQAMLISAVDSAGADDGTIARALVERAAAECRRIDYGQRIEERRLQRNGLVLASVLVTVIVIVAAGPSALRHAARTLVLSTPRAEAAGAKTIAVLPGNDTIARGADFAINAELNGFIDEDAFVVLRSDGGEWQRWPMSEGQKPGTFEAILYDVAAATDYYIESNGIRSIAFRIHVADAPYVKGVALEYIYPAYTGLARRRVENGGDVVAPRGASVRVIAIPSGPTERGRIRVDGAPPIAMESGADGTVHGAFRVNRDGLYHIELPDIDGRFTNASAQYAITAIPDEPPVVRIEKPGRDVKVTAVDEVFISAGAQDDYGISSLDLVYSVNGGAEKTQSLTRPRTRTPEATGAHTLFLEELDLKPGDIISYFARATDNNGVDGPRTTTTDIYFVQVRPFSRNYRAAEEAGMPGQGEQQEDPGALSERQRQIIAATFNVVRDRATYTNTGFAEALTTIELSQRALREQVATLVQRMQARGVVEMDSMFAEIAKLLPQAAQEMSAAEERLKQGAANDALAPEQRALQQLLRAEALYRDVQIQMQQQQGGGGGSSSMADDLADMFELERNQLRNQYESIQRSQQEQRQQAIEKEVDRLRELAQRQQQEAERQSQASAGQQQSQQGSPGGGGGAQRRLADEAEEAARRLERLARENPSPELSEAARSLQQAADEMRRASAERGGQGLSAANAARERLEEARRRLQRNEQQSLEQEVSAARQRAEQLREQQNRIAAEAEQAGAASNPEQQRRLNQQRAETGAGVGELEGRLDRMEAQARGTNPKAARELGAAADAIRNTRLRERMAAAQGSAQTRSREFNRAQDAQISRDLERVTSQLRQAEAAAGSQSREAEAESAAERARRLAQGIEGMRDRLQQQGEGEGEGQRQMQSEMRARAGELRQLQQQLRAQGMGGRPLQGAVDAMSSASGAVAGSDREKLDRLLAQVARGLEDMEFDLRQLAQQENQKKLFTSGRGQVPAEYRKAVEEYYRSLSRDRTR